MAVSTGMKLEDIFRAKYSLKKEDDLFQLIEAAIMVAVFEKKAEFRKRKARISDILNSQRPDDDVFLSSKDSDDGELPHISPAAALVTADRRSVTSGECGHKPYSGFQENKNAMNVIQENNKGRIEIQEKQRPKNRGSDQEKKGSGGIDEKKFEASERLLVKRYGDLEKRRRKIQVLDFKDVPKFVETGRVAKKIRL